MKKVLLYLTFLLVPFFLTAQYTPSPYFGTYSGCGSTSNCDSPNFAGGQLKMTVLSMNGYSGVIRVSKCSGSFQSSGTVYIVENNACGGYWGSANYYSGNSYVDVNFNYGGGGTQYIYAATFPDNSNNQRTVSGVISLTWNPTSFSAYYVNTNIACANNTTLNFSTTAITGGNGHAVSMYVDFLAPDGITYPVQMTQQSNGTYTLSRTLQQIGNYNYSYRCVQDGFESSTAQLGIITVSDGTYIKLASGISPNKNPIVTGESINVDVNLQNIYACNFSGCVRASLYKSGVFQGIIEEKTTTINGNSTNNYSFYKSQVISPIGTDYDIRIFHSGANGCNTNGTGYFLIDQGSYQNPKSVTISNPPLTIQGNSVSPTTGTSNITDFTFSASVSNADPNPVPTVDIEFQRPNGLPNETITNISNNGANYFSHTKKILSGGGAYKYRYLAYQGTRPNAYTGWFDLTVASPPAIAVIPYTVSPSTGYQNYTDFYFSAGFSGGNGTATGIEIEFRDPDYPTTQQSYVAKGGGIYTEVVYNSSNGRWELTKKMVKNGAYQYRYIIYQGTSSNASVWYNLTISPPIVITTPPSTLNWNCSQAINWTSYGVSGNVSIELTDNSGVSVVTLADGIPNSGSFSWTTGKRWNGSNYGENIPNFVSGTYKLKMYPTGTTGQGSVNNSSFTINGPTVSVTQPTAITYTKGTNMNIAWNTTNLCGNVAIEYTDAAGNNAVAIIGNTPNSGSYTWAIPSTLANGTYKIKIYVPVSSPPSPAVNYSAIFIIGSDPNCPNCLTGQTVANFVTTAQEGFCAAQYLCSKGIIQAAQTNPTLPIIREDVAKISVLSTLADNDINTAKNGGLSFPADNFPTHFLDLFQGSSGSYHRYAKILSYFQGSDNTTPFDRYKPDGITPRMSFNPTDNISRIDLIKVYLETYNLNEQSHGNPALYYTDISGLTTSELDYLKKAVQLGIVSNGTAGNSIAFRPYDINGVSGTATREEAFLILSRLRKSQVIGFPILFNNSNYYQPANQSPSNYSVMKGLEQGNFSHYSSTDFGINDIGFSLGFAHSYQSFLTMLPDEWKVVRPLGVGWSHPYNVYMFTTVQINDGQGAVAAKPLLVLAWGDGTFDVYDNTNANSPQPISVGTKYNVLTKSGSTYTIKTKSQHVYTFNQQGTEAGLYRLTSITDRYSNSLSIVYKTGATVAFSPVNQVIDYVQTPSARKIYFTYDTQNRITNVNFPGTTNNSRNLTFTYAGQNLSTFKDAKGQGNGKVTTYGYGTGNQLYLLNTITFPRGNKVENVYDVYNRLQYTQAKDANNLITGKTEITGIDNFQTNGSFVSHTRSSNQSSSQVNDISLDKNGVTTQLVSPTITIQSPADAVHPTMPASISYVGSSTQTHTPSYDANGNVLSVSRPDGKSETSTYDSYNNRLTQTDAKNITTTFNWSADGKYLNSISRPIGNGSNLSQSFGYLTNGLPSSITNNEGIVTNLGYDSYGNQNSIQIPVLSISSSAIFDYASRMTSSTNARGKTTTYQFDENDNLTQETDPLTRNTLYGYDDNDNLTTITNAKNEITTLGYDGFDRMISESFGGKTKNYVFDNSRNRLTEFRKAGYANDNTKKFSYVYDAQNRLYANGYISEILYDGLNRMSSIKGGTVATNQLSNFGYDALNRLTGYTDNYGFAVGYAYDDNGNETRIDYPNNNKVYKTYDNLNRLKTVAWNTTLLVTYNYTGSRLDNMVYGNGVKTQMSYDNAGRPNNLATKTNNGTGSTIYASTYVMDNLGNHLEENETHPFASIPTPTAGTTSGTFTNNKINNWGSSNFTHDDDGNVKTKSIGAGTNTYTYDLEDNLSNVSGTTSLSFEYDAFGNRRKALRNGTETRYVLDINGLASILAEANASNTIQNYYIQGLGLVARIKADGTIHYYHADFRGSTIAMTDASQTITHKYQYDEFGNVVNKVTPLSDTENPFLYVGAYGIMYETPDLNYMRARYYDPTTGRFNSEDPIWSTNLYPYAGNNGVNNFDLNGRETTTISDKVGSLLPCMVLDMATAFAGLTLYPTTRKYLNNYWTGDGTSQNLTKKEFQKIKDLLEPELAKPQSNASIIPCTDPECLIDNTVQVYKVKFGDFTDSDLKYAFGTASIFVKNNKVVGFYDLYNMNKSNRSRLGEVLTSFGRECGKDFPLFNAKDYHVFAGYSWIIPTK